jgi:hypothetical protein
VFRFSINFDPYFGFDAHTFMFSYDQLLLMCAISVLCEM